MATWASVRLEFLRGTISRAVIYAETGLSDVLQKEIIEGAYSPTGYTRNLLRNLYNRTAYQEMKNAGFSAAQAVRFRDYTPPSVLERISVVRELISDIARTALDKSLEKSGLSLGKTAYNDALDDFEDDITENLQKSDLSYEDWYDSGLRRGLYT